ncbi:MAG: hypothetical protein KVP17_000538 [Porospora cf. gigantea B]|uniref:uncharacterized protein n=1 Tax=Porospora cf. gigantea B TaxID=2853592 RepID=UPI003571D75F|nr:MAG: hypothetical protein KVP17_000538 [Porospora cf. gigantea B]
MFSQTGVSSLLKDGGRHYSGTEEAVLRNVEACVTLTRKLRSSMGPQSMQKLLVNHIDKVFVTSDAAVMTEQMEVEHPAAKLLVQAAQLQNSEFGDGTNFVMVFAGELLSQASALIKQGLHLADIIRGFKIASQESLRILPEFVCWSIPEVADEANLEKAVRTVVASKRYGMEDMVAKLVAKAACRVYKPGAAFNVDNVRVSKVTGGSLAASEVIEGIVHERPPTSRCTSKGACKAMALGVGLETVSTETKGTVLVNTAEELMQFTAEDETKIEAVVKAIKDAGVEVIIVGGNISDTAQHYVNKYDMLTIRTPSKFELNRLCRTVGAIPLTYMRAPSPEEVGFADSVKQVEIGSKMVTVIKSRDSVVSTIVLRGSTNNMMDEVERAIEDAVLCVKSMTKDVRFLPGAGAADMALAGRIEDFGKVHTGLEQYAIAAFAEALRVVPQVLAENAGHDTMQALTKLLHEHSNGLTTVGVDVDGPSFCLDAAENGILDHFETRLWALKLAVDSALTILRVDELIMAKPAGLKGPPKDGHWDDKEDMMPMGK